MNQEKAGLIGALIGGGLIFAMTKGFGGNNGFAILFGIVGAGVGMGIGIQMEQHTF